MTAKNAKEHFLALVKAGLNLDPYGVGGVISSLLGDYLPTSTDRSVKEFSDAFTARISELEDRIDTTEIDKDEFVELFKSAYLLTVRTHRKEKLEGAAHLLSNLLLKNGDSEKLSFTELDHFIRALDALSSGALSVFATVYRHSQRGYPQPSGYEKFTIDHLLSITGFSDSSLLLGLIREINSWNFVELSIPSIRTANDGNAGVRLTSLGARFATAAMAGNLGR